MTEVTQADRDAGIAMYRFVQSRTRVPHSPDLIEKTCSEIRCGRWDKDESVQAFARHRTTAEAAKDARIAKLREALDGLLTGLNLLPHGEGNTCQTITIGTPSMEQMNRALAAIRGAE